MKIFALLAGLFSGILGSMGLGGGTVLVIYLSLIKDTEQLKAQGINLLFFIPIAIFSVIIYSVKKQIKWKLCLKLASFGLIGAFIGKLLSEHLGGEITAKIFGVLLILIGLSEIFMKPKEKNIAKADKN
ncbi:MAG: sulfite exporter TauE/SafE family protein [Clostridia bacterium]|nr:sulfite exporter TauE/SafE family protein [Clostridia bacterium]